MVTPAGPIGRAAARRLASQELAKPGYRQHQSFSQWLADHLGRLFDPVSGSVPGGWWAAVVLVAAALAAVAVILTRIGPVARPARQRASGPLTAPAAAMTARQHRDLARRLADAGDFAGAITEHVRAIAAGLEERALLPPEPGRTADELARQAGRLLPGRAVALTDAAVVFDQVRYGGRPGTPTQARLVRDLDLAIAADGG